MSNSQKVERKLAAIMFTDIAGYTESMSYDESQAITAVKKKRSIIQPLIKDYNGIFVKEIGDGTLSYFSSAIDASTCAVKLQELTYDEEHLNIRVGLHIGDIVFDGQDVFGEGVNIASRLESLSPVGGVCVSKNVYDELENKKEFNGTSLGLQSLKGVGRLVEVYALKGDKLKEPDTSKYKETEVQKHTDDEVPSIAIIPFKNKGAEEDVFYAYGISADLISDCTGAGLIRVASKKQIDEAGDLPQDELAKKLDVRYMANGELWRMGNMFQLSIELYDTKEKKLVWSDRWQEKWDNLPSIKVNLSDGLLKALDTIPKIEKTGETNSPEAYEFYLKAIHKNKKRKSEEDIQVARGLLNKAIELDDNLIAAKILLGTTYIDMGDYEMALSIYNYALNRAKVLNNKEFIGQCYRAIGALYWHNGYYDKSLKFSNQALDIFNELNNKIELANIFTNIGISYWRLGNYKKALIYNNKNLNINKELESESGKATSLNNMGLTYISSGDFDKALDCLKESIRLTEIYESENKSKLSHTLDSIGYAYIGIGDYNKALEFLKRAYDIAEELAEKRNMVWTLNGIGLCYYYLNDYKEAILNLKKCKNIEKEIESKEKDLEITTFLFNAYKKLNIKYDINELIRLISITDNIEHEINFELFKLLSNKSYLETAYNQIQEKVDAMETKLKEKFLNYPIPKQILEEWNKINN